MGKVKRPARKHSNHHDSPQNSRSAVVRRQHSQKQALPAKNAQEFKSRGAPLRPKIPFTKHDNILLLGEGNFSFTLALKLHHKFYHVISTCFDTRETLHTKYPDIAGTLSQIDPEYLDMCDGLPTSQVPENEWKGFSPSPSPSNKTARKIDVLYGIDATKLSSAHKKMLRESTPFTKIVFNFPHVGGLSTDVNRQVRHNQELLVGFFKAAKDLLSSPERPARVNSQSEVYKSDEEYLSDDMTNSPRSNAGAVNGQVLVTIFEGEPYTLWNIRDLARHCGFKVVESFKFPWSAYPGYQHARTIGDITSGHARNEDGKRKGAWRGEERDARCYVLEDKDAVPHVGHAKASKRKRNEKDDDSE
ncbi:uncharacterized protein A1O9_03407 [Exophiala aquamarina CBS 119918]|uniref:25S rRNA (uridine-N(3))-methyltransferase BMT5-like domain-containing protein n=1 Tax=Exophiala aquamarina CBS 119918 TaxID=1182545 RepID=A0A072PPP2_9EURO|nr:uncharacterized protein A1O9_03407 [Exophiala aquamarina CBS 119918]KEF61836.1 hypothetical protein A1O9_03407 [Exophiala aquamarina CBS 119918]